MTKSFGTSPWSRTFYGPVDSGVSRQMSENDSNEMKHLKMMLERLKRGDFSAREGLVKLITHPTYELRQYATQLFVDVCGHKDVIHLSSIMDLPEERHEVYRVAFRLGDTFTLGAVPLLLKYWEDYEDGLDPEFEESIRIALDHILPREVVEKCSLSQQGFNELMAYVESIDHRPYYYRGKPIFMGDLTKKMVTGAVTSNKEKRPFTAGSIPHYLSSFTGIQCPSRSGEILKDDEVCEILRYVEKVAQLNLEPGVKYFYGHRVS